MPSSTSGIGPGQPELPPGLPGKRFGSFLGYLFVSLLFTGCVWLAGKTGVRLALRSLPASSENGPRIPDGQSFTLGSVGSPLYLADGPEGLREFYLNFPNEKVRVEATRLSDYGIRRVFGSLEMMVERYDADAVQVRILSGSISGAIYWIHVSALKNLPSRQIGRDAIIDPIPTR